MRDGLRMFGDYSNRVIRYRRGKGTPCEYVLAFYHSIAILNITNTPTCHLRVP